MKPQAIFSFLRVATSVLYYFLLVITVLVVATSLFKFSGNDIQMNGSVFSYEVMAFDAKSIQSVVKYSADSLIKYSPIANRYKVDVEPNSLIGYYSFVSKLLHLLLGLAVLWNFRRIFGEANQKEPFTKSIFKRLVVLAILFGASDFVSIANYLIFNSLLHQWIPTPHFNLITDVGNSFITGLIIYAIAVIYQRGLLLQEENALTI